MTPRIVSLIASSTEIVHALGMGEYMVGRSHECDYPTTISNLPICTGPKFRTDGSSYEIDQRVKAIVQESLSVYKVYADVLEELKPSHIITQAQCEVCAVSLRDVEEAACELISSQPRIVSLQPDCLEDVWTDIRKVGDSLQISSEAEGLIEQLKSRITEVIADAAKAERNMGRKPKVAIIEWIDPLMAAGNWMPELVEMAHGVNLFGIAGKHSPWMSWEDLVAKDPDVIIVTPCGFDNKRTLEEMHLISGQPHYDSITAVKNNRVYVADGNQYFNRPGPRLVDSLEMLVEMIFPGEKNYGHRATGWRPYP
ncbi:MAG: cobalamin-binding protein, partial [Candidatus Obscuribacterales bacterium]|nr:cobalamin-binding protein [Candidatus Obscuribacterales bacterium]